MAHALIVGAGIAGDALAVLLDRQGWRVTVAEIAPGLRKGGQTVDLRAGSREVLARMGVLDTVLASLVAQRGLAWIDETGKHLAAMPVEAFDGQGFVSKEEVLRTDLARILHNVGSAGIRYRFNETVESLDDRPDGVSVRFRSGDVDHFDVVVGADGVHSRVRGIRWGEEEQFRNSLGIAHAWYTLDERADTPPLDGWFLMHNAPGGLMVEARPGHAGTQEVGLSFRTTEPLPPRGDRAAQLDLLERTFRDVGWRAAEIVSRAPNAADFALDTYDQIAVPKWHDGRVVLLGDSAWCASPLSGLGTALALLGAEVLAQELADGTEPIGDAFARYEDRMRRPAQEARKLLPGRVGMFVPMTQLGIRVWAVIWKAAQWRVAAPILKWAMAGRGRDSPDV
ncbi:FAD-dependent monooxygenase [Glaciihabitans sp. dw_435]|uniref:FAD-dependent monooxygenase n=1 Tax=Glaciihabitans sp. dw_435 TaxID=2720081 RepID=UPI001BD446DC|nr:FAD-dependent monooxygenase [Glaciihabitans sp. dw_435]